MSYSAGVIHIALKFLLLMKFMIVGRETLKRLAMKL